VGGTSLLEAGSEAELKIPRNLDNITIGQDGDSFAHECATLARPPAKYNRHALPPKWLPNGLAPFRPIFCAMRNPRQFETLKNAAPRSRAFSSEQSGKEEPELRSRCIAPTEKDRPEERQDTH
jgi:hypothetical protein